MASFARLIPELQPWAQKLVDLANRAGVQPRVTSTFRTLAKQQQLYAIWKAGGSPYPVATPGTSSHEFGYAFDMVVDNATDQTDLGKVWEGWGGVWGGRYGDPVHYEFPGFTATQAAPAGKRSCSTATSLLAQAVDLVLGFLPGVGEVELVSTLVSLGFPRSRVLKYLSNPISTATCG